MKVHNDILKLREADKWARIRKIFARFFKDGDELELWKALNKLRQHNNEAEDIDLEKKRADR